MDEQAKCPRCGRPLGAGDLAGLCPECLLAAGLAADTLATGGPEARPGRLAPPLAPGQPFGRYRIVRRLGEGGMGVVYEAQDTESGRRVALKVLRQQLDSPQDRARFLREGRAAASINHPNCVYVFGTEEVAGTPTIAMEYIGGRTLAHRLSCEGPLPVGRAVDAMLQVIDGLEAAQAVGVLHRDIKPSNCFEDGDGRVKIGDFGLSISTLPRAETEITRTGTVVGTPAFCSPEQLRGDELGARADLYAVGVTLFQLLTGRLPFEGENMAQLIANTLEQPAPSPRRYRREIPSGLARAILRCLAKHPSDRFRSYADLRRALDPYASASPRPATLGLRFVAGLLDMVLLGAAGQAAAILAFGNPFTAMDRILQDVGRAWQFVLPWLFVANGYYALCEWRWGATLGKAACRLRVVRTDRAYPRLGQALARAMLYQVVPVLPYWIVAALRADLLLSASAGTYALSLAYYGLLALLFSTARRRNGFAAVHDLATRTRIISRAALESRVVPAPVEAPRTALEGAPRIGPYHVLRTLETAADATWIEGYDLRLLRRVLVRSVPPGTPPVSSAIRNLSRVGRLRWLSGRREGEENWDAFEWVGGQVLPRQAGGPQPWREVRYWLHDLAEELAATEQDGSLPLFLSPDRVWITDGGRAKLFDLPAPGSDGEPPGHTASDPAAFLDQVAALALGGGTAAGHPAAAVARPLPLHVREFLSRLPDLAGAGAVASALQPLLRRTATVTRFRRTAAAAACVVIPLALSVGALFGLSIVEQWRQQNPGLMELQQLLQTRKTRQLPFVPDDSLPSDAQFGLYIAAHYRDLVADAAVWSNAMARVLINGEGRAFAERSLDASGAAAPEEIAAADQAVAPLVDALGRQRAIPPRRMASLLFASTLIMYVGVPAVLAALLFRGGLVLLATGITFVRKDGRRASRLRLFWRALITWVPLIGAVGYGVVALQQPWRGWLLVGGVSLVALIAGSLALPERGLADRLAGTWPVPR